MHLRVIALVASLVPACLYDPADRCGAHQYLEPKGGCVCEADTVMRDGRCEPCPAGEVAAGDACVCPMPLVRDTGSNSCIAPPSGQGLACTASEPCPSADDPLCTAGGYCSRACTAPADCTGGYACDLAAAAPYCARPPSGLSAPCADQADCAAFEASYCETAIGHVCLVAGCSLDPDDCFVGWECCDVSGFGAPVGTLCVPEGMCPSSM